MKHQNLQTNKRRQNINEEVSFEDLTKWIIKNRGTKAFVDYDYENLLFILRVASIQNLLLYAINDNKITGVMVLQKLEPFKIHINNVLSIQPGFLRLCILMFRQLWPQTNFLTAHRKGKLVEYNLNNLDRITKSLKV